MFSVIPQDLLLRVYYETKTPSDLLIWMFGNEQFQKMKMNQLLFHISILVLQGSSYSKGEKMDTRIGLEITKICHLKHSVTAGIFEYMITFLLIR